MEKSAPLYFEELVEFIRAIGPVSDEAIEMIRPLVGMRNISKGEFLYRAHETSHYVYMLRNGIMRNFMDDDGHEITRWFAVAGDVFTSLQTLNYGEPSLSSVEAITKGEAWVLDVAAARRIIHESREWREWLLKLFMDGIAITERRDYRFISTDAYTRFTQLADYRTKEFMNQIPLSVLASYLRVSPRTLTRCRNRYFKERK